MENGNVFNANNERASPTSSNDVRNVSYADALRKNSSESQNVVQSSQLDELNNVNDISFNDATHNEVAHSNDGISELETTNATCESLESIDSEQSNATLEVTDSLTDVLGSPDVKSIEKDKSDPSTHSEATEDQAVSEILLNSSHMKTETEVSSLSITEQSIATNEEMRGSSSDLSSEEYNASDDDNSASDEFDIADTYPAALRWKFREADPKLPSTVSILIGPKNSKVYLVGTAHFSLESQDDVAKTIRATQPDVVMVELCKSRVNMLSQDEEFILEESRNMNLEKIRAAIRQNGFKQGILYLLLLNVSAHLTKQLGMAPGGEFRKAYTEAKKVPGCVVQLGDRSIHVTLQRALAACSLWQKLKIAWYLLTNRDPISQQDVERCKEKDLLEQMLAEMTGEFPQLSEVFVRERDIFLAYSLQMAAIPMPPHVINSYGGVGEPSKVIVGVVGIGHVPGIKEKWNTVTEDDILPILTIPEPSTSSKIMGFVFRCSTYGLLAYGCYRLVPKSAWRKSAGMIASLIRR